MPSTYSARSERYAWIETKARQYARSGNYLNYKAIEAVLIEKGYPEARKLSERGSMKDKKPRKILPGLSAGR